MKKWGMVTARMANGWALKNDTMCTNTTIYEQLLIPQALHLLIDMSQHSFLFLTEAISFLRRRGNRTSIYSAVTNGYAYLSKFQLLPVSHH